MDRCRTNPEEAKYVDEDLCTPLHMVCYCSDPPIAVIEALLVANVESTAVQNKWHRTPLHIAVDSASPRVVKALLNANSSSVWIRGSMNTYTLTYLCWWHKSRILRAFGQFNATTTSEDRRRILEQDVCLQGLWKKACLLVKAMYYATEVMNDSEEGVVHACCGIEDCPDILLRLAIALRPQDLSVPDSYGNTPLHITAQSPFGTCQMDKPFFPLSYILSIDNNSARLPNAKGDVPLILALRTGTKQWNEGIDQLVNAFPGALTMMDNELQGLYPFMVAATTAIADSRDANKSHQLCSVYNMLRACPELERFACY